MIGCVFLAGMVATAGYAAWTLPAGARVPLNVGIPEFSLWLPKLAGLAAWLGAGVVAFAVFASVTLNGHAAAWVSSLRVVLLPCAMMIVLAAEAGAVISARQRADDRVSAEMAAAMPVAEPDAAAESAPEAVQESPPEAAAESAPEAAAESAPEAAAESAPEAAQENEPEAVSESE